MGRFFFNIDVLGSCNLRCPSCPVGNTKDVRNPTGFMDPALLSAVVAKAKAECEVTGIALFNWTEPILHPRLPELIRIVESNGIHCYLSSNLNLMRNIDAILAENPYALRISVSGFTQQIYGYSHRGGNVEVVKKHMAELAEAKRRTGSTTRVDVLYHRYKHNLQDEPLMRAYAAGLGFGFQGVWAFMMPLEKILAHVNDDPGEATLTAEDHRLIGNLALPLEEAITAAEKHRDAPCSLRDAQITMDFEGNVQRCCGTFDSSKFTLGKYLTSSLDQLQTQKYAHDMCGRCMRRGAHVYGTYGAPEFDAIAARTVGPANARLLRLRSERARKRIRLGVQRVYGRTVGRWLTAEQSARLGRGYERVEHLFTRGSRS